MNSAAYIDRAALDYARMWHRALTAETALAEAQQKLAEFEAKDAEQTQEPSPT